MVRRVSRGLLGITQRASPFKTTLSVRERVERKMQTLQTMQGGGFPWKETWQEFKHLSKSHPDLHGRRLYDPKAVKKAQYVARVAYRAYARAILPEGKEWGYLRTAVTQVYKSLGYN